MRLIMRIDPCEDDVALIVCHAGLRQFAGWLATGKERQYFVVMQQAELAVPIVGIAKLEGFVGKIPQCITAAFFRTRIAVDQNIAFLLRLRAAIGQLADTAISGEYVQFDFLEVCLLPGGSVPAIGQIHMANPGGLRAGLWLGLWLRLCIGCGRIRRLGGWGLGLRLL